MYSNIGDKGFKSAVSGKSYYYEQDPYGTSKRNALKLMESEDAQYRQAAATRPRHDSAPPPTAAKITHSGGNQQSDRERLEGLKRHLLAIRGESDWRPGAKAAKQARIVAFEQKVAEAEAALEAKEQRAAARENPVYVETLAGAKERLDLLLLRGDVSQDLVDEARQSVATLEIDLDTDAFRARAESIQSRSRSERDSQIAVLRQHQEELRQEIMLTREALISDLGETEPAPETPAE